MGKNDNFFMGVQKNVDKIPIIVNVAILDNQYNILWYERVM